LNEGPAIAIKIQKKTHNLFFAMIEVKEWSSLVHLINSKNVNKQTNKQKNT
jgi:hypothetical protein